VITVELVLLTTRALFQAETRDGIVVGALDATVTEASSRRNHLVSPLLSRRCRYTNIAVLDTLELSVVLDLAGSRGIAEALVVVILVVSLARGRAVGNTDGAVFVRLVCLGVAVTSLWHNAATTILW
jgi:hypothetical protein